MVKVPRMLKNLASLPGEILLLLPRRIRLPGGKNRGGVPARFGEAPVRVGVSVASAVALLLVTFSMAFGLTVKGSTQLVSGVRNDELGDGDSEMATMAFSGRWVAFNSKAHNLVDPSNDNRAFSNIFLLTRYKPDQPEYPPVMEELTFPAAENGGGGSYYPVFSRYPAMDPTDPTTVDLRDGRYLVFQTNSETLVGGDSNGKKDIILWDRDATHKLSIVSLPEAGSTDPQANDHSGANSSKVPFTMQNPYHAGAVVYADCARDWADTDRKCLMDEQPAGSGNYVLHDSAPLVIFESTATNLVNTGSPITNQYLYLRDVQGVENLDGSGLPVRDGGGNMIPTTRVITRKVDGSYPHGDFSAPAINTSIKLYENRNDRVDGRFVAFVSNTRDLMSPVPAGLSSTINQVYVIDRDFDQNGVYDEYSKSGGVKVYLVSRQDGGGVAGNDNSGNPSVVYYLPPSTPADQHPLPSLRVAFHSYANNLISADPDTNNAADIFVFELAYKAHNGDPVNPDYLEEDWSNSGLYRVSKNSEEDQASNDSVSPAFSGNGQIIAFTSYANNLVLDDSNYNCLTHLASGNTDNCPDVYVHDTRDLTVPMNATWRVSLTEAGEEAQKNSGLPAVNGFGRYVAFNSYADLMNEGEQLNRMQIYLRDQGEVPGNPQIIPPFGEFYSWIGQPVRQEFTVRFLGPLSIGQIKFMPKDNSICTANPNSRKCYYPELYGGNPDGSGGLVEQDPGHPCFNPANQETGHNEGDTCTFYVTYTPKDRNERRARISITLPGDDRLAVYVGLRGTTIVRYMPLIAPMP